MLNQHGSRPRVSLARFVAAGLGSGRVPLAPGTSGSLAALLAAWLIIQAWGVISLWLAWVLLLPVACWSTYVALSGEKETDPGWIVVDEWLGQWLTLLIVFVVLPVSLLVFALAFAGFRFFDILKPGPIRAIEHVGPDWWSIHADDLLAGILAGVTLLAGYFILSLVFGPDYS